MDNHNSTTHKGICVHTLVFVGFLLIGAFFLITEHRAHVLGWLPFILLAACPLMHLFMHKGHGDNSTDQEHHQEDNQPKT
jgi:hypothetical protein